MSEVTISRDYNIVVEDRNGESIPVDSADSSYNDIEIILDFEQPSDDQIDLLDALSDKGISDVSELLEQLEEAEVVDYGVFVEGMTSNEKLHMIKLIFDSIKEKL